MRRRTFLSSVFGGLAGWLPLAARSDAQEQQRHGPEAPAPLPHIPDYWVPLLTLTLATGREIRLEGVVARRTYCGLISGRPDNADTLHEIKEYCRRVLFAEHSIILPPVMVTREDGGEYWIEYPPVFVAARFSSIGGARRPHADFSELSVGWFQSSLQPLISDQVLAAIQKLDWLNLAHDVWW